MIWQVSVIVTPIGRPRFHETFTIDATSPVAAFDEARERVRKKHGKYSVVLLLECLSEGPERSEEVTV